MKKVIIVTALVMSTFAHAEMEKSPTMHWQVTKNMTNKTEVTIVNSEWVEKDCQKESVRRGQGGFAPLGKNQFMEGCSFWYKDQNDKHYCTIILGKTTNNDILGHEMRHCLQGSFH